jgi:hypothetical protein
MAKHMDPATRTTIASAYYGAFVIQMMKARPAVAVLLGEADRAKLDSAAVADARELQFHELGITVMAAAAQVIRNDVDSVVRHNCCGAAFQITYSLFENFVASLGLKPGSSLGVGASVRGEPASRILWAARNLFVHSDEWKRRGPKGKTEGECFAILKQIGFSDPASANAHDVYVTAFNGNVDALFQSVLDAAKSATQSSALMPVDATALAEVIPLLGGHALFTAAVALDKMAHVEEPDGIEGIIAVQFGTGTEAVTIPIATGKLRNPARLTAALHEGAIKRLTADSAQPFLDAAEELSKWKADFEVLNTLDLESAGYHEILADICERAFHIHERARSLPDPRQVLISERGVRSYEEYHALATEILGDYGFAPVEFRQVPVDIASATAAKTVGPSPDDTARAQTSPEMTST